jgi:RNA polymerase sigma-70 factor (ECF subfamily)
MFAKRSSEADDLFQEVLINLWKGYSSFEGRSEVATWVWRVSLNTCITADRKAKSRHKAELAMKQNLYEDDDTDSKQIRKLYARIRQLKPFDRAIVLLWLENLSYDEIAAIVGISVKNVSVRLVRIREQLKNMSNEE